MGNAFGWATPPPCFQGCECRYLAPRAGKVCFQVLPVALLAFTLCREALSHHRYEWRSPYASHEHCTTCAAADLDY
jgi:hypothetical protein